MTKDDYIDQIRKTAIESLKSEGYLTPKALLYLSNRSPISFVMDLERRDHTLEVLNIMSSRERPEFIITVLDTWVRIANDEIEHPKGLQEELKKFKDLRDLMGCQSAISIMMFSKDGRITSQIIPYEKNNSFYDFGYGSEEEIDFNEETEEIDLKRWW